MMTHLEIIEKKIINTDELSRMVAFWQFKKQRIVFTNGCFDLMHLGHVDYLSKAADLGDVLIVGINTDASVKRLKGENRPLQDEKARATMLASLQFVTAVVFFDEDTPLELIKVAQPDVLTKGADYEVENIVGYDEVTAKGGKVVTLPLVEGYSTTNLVEKIKQSKN